MHDPKEPHLATLKRILRYVCGTLDYGLQLYSSSTSLLVAYLYYRGETKYRGVANVVAKTSWLWNLLRELHSPLHSLTIVYCDNVSVVYMFSNPVQHQRTKHIEIDIHFVRDRVAASHVYVLHVLSSYHYADIFTVRLKFVCSLRRVLVQFKRLAFFRSNREELLLEQWKKSYETDYYDYDPYDDDMYEGQEIPDKIISICDNLDIKVRGRNKK
uniref:Ribonuclease H-like domain-containing protein n=1 Tax=Tanacetum cinerariifolium TaxID=118510 RepID=A0A6L2MTU5_TANCI|nr:ribonuclease H-like domain-containing protein [Tanacetum cinerariifolium]